MLPKLPGHLRASTLKSEEERESFKAVLFVLNGTSLDTPPAAVPIRLFLWG